ncbi:superoxide dismutase [Xylaria nigripes]|nr:superoxide dismutase [Xylaria nigripes]
MHISRIFLSAALGTCVLAQADATGKLGDAISVTNNPIGKSAIAELPKEPFTPGSLDGNIKGSVKATTGPDGVGVDFEVSFSNLPKEGGPFIYHIHVEPVNEAGNCTETLAHLDPFIRGETPSCDPSKPASCQIGDLSGKYGSIKEDPFTAKFHDNFTSMVEGPGSYFLNRSIVVHFANKTRITCANFAVLNSTGNDASNTSGSGPHTSATGVPTSGGPINAVSSTLITVAKGIALLPTIAVAFGL